MKQITRCFECGKILKKIERNKYGSAKKYSTHEGCNIGGLYNSGRLLYNMPIRARKFLGHDYKINHDKYFPF